MELVIGRIYIVVSKATRHGLDGSGFVSQWETRFSVHVLTELEAHPS
jgi:hypothetical protein